MAKPIAEIATPTGQRAWGSNQIYVPVDDGIERKKVYLHPGQIHTSSDPTAITTVLGSCVAVCLWDPVAKVGGANHYLLPQWPGEGSAPKRYGDMAIQQLLEEILKAGARKKFLQAKIFGGAQIFENLRSSRGTHFGDQNVSIARRALQTAGLQITTEDVGGTHGRKVIFQTDTGACWTKRL